MYRRTNGYHRCRDLAAEDQTTEVPLVRVLSKRSRHLSKKFSWLPTEFKISEDRRTAAAQANINNVHPDEKILYQIIENYIAACPALRTCNDRFAEGQSNI